MPTDSTTKIDLTAPDALDRIEAEIARLGDPVARMRGVVESHRTEPASGEPR